MKYLNPLVAAALLQIALTGFSPTSRAQTTAQEKDTDERLARIVNIVTPDITLEQVVTDIATQTGARLHAAPYLASHVVAVRMRNVSAIRFLGVLTELFGWELDREPDGGARIVLPPAKIPQNIDGVPNALRVAMSAEYRRYLGFDTPLTLKKNEDLAPLRVQREMFSSVLKHTLGVKVGDADALHNDRLQHIWAGAPTVDPRMDLPAAKWTEEQKQNVLLSLFDLTIARSWATPQCRMFDALYAGPHSFESRPEASDVHIDFNHTTGQISELVVGAEVTDAQGNVIYTRFGANIRFVRNEPAPRRPQ